MKGRRGRSKESSISRKIEMEAKAVQLAVFSFLTNMQTTSLLTERGWLLQTGGNYSFRLADVLGSFSSKINVSNDGSKSSLLSLWTGIVRDG